VNQERPISICLISPKAYPLLDPSVQAAFGGAEVDLYYLATELARDPMFKVSMITADYGQPAEQVIENVRVLKSLRFDGSFLAGAMKIYRALRAADAEMYLIKTFSPGVPLVYSFCRLGGRKFLYRTAHQNDSDGTYRRRHPIRGRIFEYCLRHADGIFVQNQSDQESLKARLGVDSIVIRNGHRMIPSSPQERDCILWAGRSAAFKHPERFLDLADHFPQEQFVMICRRDIQDTEYSSLCRKAAGLLNLEFIEEVPFREMDRYYARAKVFVNTSDAEGFPNTFIQATRAGTAILSWQVNPDQFLTRYQCGLACGASMEKLCKGLKFLLEGCRYREIGQNGLRYCREHHDISVLVDVYKKHLYRLAGRRLGEPG
jgi:glycosyltransferase involved in cell wall biosynthesis